MKKVKGKGITRRDFIKGVGYTAGAIGISSTFPEFLKPARAASRDHILIGRPVPKTGPIAAFAESTPWLDNRALAEINKDGGIYIKEYGKKVPVKVKILDTESNPTKAAEIGSRLIVKDKIDMMYVSSTPATVNPVAGVCERYKVPSVSTMMPVEMFLHGGPYHWAFDASCSVPDMVASYLDSWTQVKTNKIVGLLAANDADGMAWAKGAQSVLEPAGYKVVDLGRFPGGTMDFGAFISGWKKAKVEILFANLAPPDFIRAWRQCHRDGFIPKICAIGRAVLFPSVVEAIGGDLGIGTSTEVLWHPAFPFKSSLTGYPAKTLADAYEKASGKQWTQPLGGFYLGWEIVADVFRRTQSIDKETLRKAIADTNLDTIGGHVKFNDKNVAVTPVGLIQWVKGKKFKFDCRIVSKGNFANVVTQANLMPIPELRK
ncbi:ABC transporter substrate-binding protein [Thermodesulfobacteriota bacterium]